MTWIEVDGCFDLEGPGQEMHRAMCVGWTERMEGCYLRRRTDWILGHLVGQETPCALPLLQLG